MQTNNEYRELMDEARRKHLANIHSVSREIAKLYDEAAKDLAKRARKHRKGTLSERWATEYTKQLRKRSKELYSDLYEVTLQGLKRSSYYPVIATGEFFSIVGGQSFADALANTPDLVMAEILSGNIYKDKQGLSARIWGTTKGLERDVDYIVNRAIAEHKSAVNLAADLEEYVQDSAKRSWDWGKVYPNLRGKRVDYNAQRLARTSINHSYWLSNVKTCERNPFVTAMHWELSMSHEVRQVIPFGRDCCDDYAEHYEGLGVGNFPVDKLPLPHPQCLCVQWAVIPESLEDIGTEIGRWMAGEPNARLDTWYQKEYGEELKNTSSRGIINSSRSMSSGLRTSPFHILDDNEISVLKQEILDIGADENVFVFNAGSQTGYVEHANQIQVCGDVLPDLSSTNNRDIMSSRAVLAHEYYGHYMFAPSEFPIGDWRDEMRASYIAALKAPNLTQEERASLMVDAYERAYEAGYSYKYSKKAREIIYGY